MCVCAELSICFLTFLCHTSWQRTDKGTAEVLTQMHGRQAPAAAAAKAGDARAFSMERSAAAGAGAVADTLAASWSADGASAVAAGDEGAWALADDVKK